jgi:hypothetical protein
VLAADGGRGGHGWSSGRGGVAWRVREKTTRSTRAAAGRGATRGNGQKQEVVLVGLQRRRAVAQSSSAGGRTAWQGVERPARSGERQAGCWSSTWRTEGRCGAIKARHMAGAGGGGGAERSRERRELEVDEGT